MEDIQIPKNILNKWQIIVNILAQISSVPVALIMRVELPHIKVFRSSKTEGNPYNIGDSEYLIGSGLYCEYVIKNREMLHVPNALEDKDWNQNPDIKLGMISYLGFPLKYPNDNIFGTICILDLKENEYNSMIKKLLFHFKEVIESHLELIYLNQILAKSEKEYKQLVSLANAIILKMDKNANIEYINQYGTQLLGFKKNELNGKNVLGTIVPKNDTSGKDLEHMVKNIFHSPDKFKITENENITKDGKKLWISWANQAIINEMDEFIGILSIGTDITEKKIAEKKLIESEERYRKAYEEVNFYKDLFSHDISNSMQVISSLLDHYSFKKVNPEAQMDNDDLFIRMRKSSDRAINLIHNVRKLSEIEESDIILGKIEILNILKTKISDIEEIYNKTELNVQVDCKTDKIYVKVNELIENVFENILINAINYNNKSIKAIKIKISEVDDFIKFEFIDNGIGIPEEIKKIIFESGFKKRKGSKGMGLGLSLVKKIIDKYGGKIWVEDKIKGDYRKGSNFCILIPKA